VKSSHLDIQAVLAREGVIALREHPDLVGPIRWLIRNGDLHVVLPAGYAPRLDVDTFDTRIRALRTSDPNAVLVGTAAACVSFWPTIRVPVVTCALKHHRRSRRGFRFSRREVPADLVMSRAGIRYTSPAMPRWITASLNRSDLGADTHTEQAILYRPEALQ
jgi:hypothetical protein